jgi:hypothetical protein
VRSEPSAFFDGAAVTVEGAAVTVERGAGLRATGAAIDPVRARCDWLDIAS